jgi:DNA-binding transcriptional MerR regulator
MSFYRIKEAAEKVGVLPHVLRFWESQFPTLKPTKTTRGQRLYSGDDIENFVKIKHLLYVEGYSIPGAKKYLKEQRQGVVASPEAQVSETLSRNLLEELLGELRALNQLAAEM